jgi:hypothetical protein
MNKPSERIVVFVTPAQKRAISATADELGISVSELMRRAVIAFSATSDQVKAASIVDRLNAPREPDALAQVLRKAAKPLRVGRSAGIRPAAQVPAPEAAADDADNVVPARAQHDDAGPIASANGAATEPTGEATNEAEHTLAQAVARLSAEAHAAELEAKAQSALPENPHFHDVPPLPPLSEAPFLRTQRLRDEEDAPDSDPAPQGGKFA